MEATREALQYVAGLAVESEQIEVKEICGKTYATKSLTRYDRKPKADPIGASSLTALVDYIRDCSAEFERSMIVHIISPTKVRLMSVLDGEREREILFETNAETSKFEYDRFYDQENMMIMLQANFENAADLPLVLKAVGNIERKNEQTYTDNGTNQIATAMVGVATKVDIIVPNPVELVPFRTFQEVPQPASKFVFRIGDKEVPAFKIVEAEGGVWKNEAIANIKEYLQKALDEMIDPIKSKITVIG